MLYTDHFIKYLIGTAFTLLIVVNIIYAFNLVGSLGLPFAYQSGIDDYSNKYFGAMNLINGFQAFFNENDFLNKIRAVMSKWYEMMNSITIDNITDGFVERWSESINFTFDPNALVTSLVLFLCKAASKLFDLFVNLPYIFMVIIYFLLFLFYVISVAFQFISFAFYLLSGMCYSLMPNTEFPDPEIQWVIDPTTGLPVIANSFINLF